MSVTPDMLNSGAGAALGTTDLPPSARPQDMDPVQPTPPPAPHSGILGNILHAVGDALGGPKSRQAVDPATGNIQNQPLSGRERAAGIIARTILGAGAGLGQHGPGAFGRSIVAGADISNRMLQQQRQNTMEESQNVRQGLMDRATIAYHNNQMLLEQRNQDRLDAEAKARIADSNRNFEMVAQQNGFQKPPIMLDGKDINGTSGNEADMMKYFSGAGSHQPPDGYTYLYVPSSDEKGNPTHTVYLAPVNTLNQPVTIDRAAFKQQTGLDAPGKGPDVTLPMKDLIGLRSKFVESNLQQAQTKHAEQETKSAEKLLPGQVAQQGATLAHTQAETEKTKAETEALGTPATVNIAGDPVGLPGESQKDLNKRNMVFDKSYVQPLVALQKTGTEFHRIETDPKMTPAEKVTGLLAAVGISFNPLKGLGPRVTRDTIGEHAQARDIYQAALQKISQVRPGGGGPITEKQIHDYAAIARGVIHDAYVAAGRESVRQGLNPNFLPHAQMLPNGQPPVVDRDTAQIYIDVFNGNISKAHNALVAQGFAP